MLSPELPSAEEVAAGGESVVGPASVAFVETAALADGGVEDVVWRDVARVVESDVVVVE